MADRTVQRQSESSMPARLWLVTVDCIQANGPTLKVKVLVECPESSDADAVAEEALRIAEEKAPMGPKWIEFYSREVVSITLPWIVTETRWSSR